MYKTRKIAQPCETKQLTFFKSSHPPAADLICEQPLRNRSGASFPSTETMHSMKCPGSRSSWHFIQCTVSVDGKEAELLFLNHGQLGPGSDIVGPDSRLFGVLLSLYLYCFVFLCLYFFVFLLPCICASFSFLFVFCIAV